MLVRAGLPMVRINREVPAIGGWLSTPVRSRKGRHISGSLSDLVQGSGPLLVAQEDRILSAQDLWNVYKRTPDVRAPIDDITRQIATWDWKVEPAVDPADPQYQEALDISEECRRFLAAPNHRFTWQEVMTQYVTDVLVFEAGAMELAENANGELAELVPLRGYDIRPVVTDVGMMIEWRQEQFGVASGSDVRFDVDELVYSSLYPNTSAQVGVPLIETIITEVIAILRAAERAMLTLDADEIPPGILTLAGIAAGAAKAATADLQNMAGRDNKIRVISTPDPKGVAANWVNMQHTNHEVSLIDVVDQIRRTIWRIFGVMPVEMGATDGMPRATAQVQLDVSNSQLIAPILEGLQAKMNAKVLPKLINDPEKQHLVRFVFDREAKLTPKEQQEQSQTLIGYVGNGIVTRNEARQTLGYAPIMGGDVPTVTTSAGPIPLMAFLEYDDDDDEPEVIDITEEPDDDEDGGVDRPGVGTPDEGEEAPGEATPERSHSCSCRKGRHAMHAMRSNPDLPSDWQPAGRFRDVRTLNLVKLADIVSDYARAVEPHYVEAMDEVLAAFGAAYRDGKITDGEEYVVTNALGAAMDKLAVKWAAVTQPYYEQAARIGRDAASNMNGATVLEDWKTVGRTYQEQSMGWLVETGGLISDVKMRVLNILGAVVNRSVVPAPDYIEAGVEEGLLMNAVSKAFTSQQTRINNWSGKLVQLTNQAMRQGLLEVPRSAEEEWWYAWEAVGDKRTCPTCIQESVSGYRPVSQQQIFPGGGTECGARCRCVVVLWKQQEVTDGTAYRVL
jgi:hypothetical protein